MRRFAQLRARARVDAGDAHAARGALPGRHTPPFRRGARASRRTRRRPARRPRPPSDVGQTTATLKAKVDPNGAATTYKFEYGTTDSYGLSTAEKSAGDGTSSVDVERPVTGLTSDTTYHVRIVATNAAGVTRGADRTFTTQSAGRAPGVSSRLRARRQAEQRDAARVARPARPGDDLLLRVGHVDPLRPPHAAGQTPRAAARARSARAITGLSPYTTYHYRLVATNASARRAAATAASARCARRPASSSASPATPRRGAASVTLSGKVHRQRHQRHERRDRAQRLPLHAPDLDPAHDRAPAATARSRSTSARSGRRRACARSRARRSSPRARGSRSAHARASACAAAGSTEPRRRPDRRDQPRAAERPRVRAAPDAVRPLGAGRPRRRRRRSAATSRATACASPRSAARAPCASP